MDLRADTAQVRSTNIGPKRSTIELEFLAKELLQEMVHASSRLEIGRAHV